MKEISRLSITGATMKVTTGPGLGGLGEEPRCAVRKLVSQVSVHE